MNINTKLQSSDILKKEFRTKTIGGYNPDEVDAYLDDIIQDYEGMEKYISQLEAENASLREDVLRTSEDTQQVEESENIISDTRIDDTMISTAEQSQETNNVYAPVDESYPSTTNYDILRRLSNLERKVFGEEKTTTESAQNFYGDDSSNN
ncbi:cell cycle protein GpsB [Companilactobacillus sp. RD055328]|uniref:DivIVA domain-containing protein n=1 Tax=Companilactobacillus sp. RD055328 TaxID=2916634 RepID=UPI001FC84902|nr:DivIVA domain-containing protein [Companilactobacillus sp. RD055328]GKQ42689.1 cell cycle protein GpsB [Companilactobacillus sp. RD055328]